MRGRASELRNAKGSQTTRRGVGLPRSQSRGDFWFPRTVKEGICVVLSHQVWGNFLQLQLETNTDTAHVNVSFHFSGIKAQESDG